MGKLDTQYHTTCASEQAMRTVCSPLLPLLQLLMSLFLLPLVLSNHLYPAAAATTGGRLHLRDASDFPSNTSMDRSLFPSNFIFGTLTMAIKHEGHGSVNVTQKAENIWDAYALHNDTILDGTEPGIAGGQYDRYEEDIELVEQMGMDAYRFSIAWTRIFPNGTGSDILPNLEAIAHYNALIDMLVEKDIDPHVTLWSEDHPQALEDEYGGLLSPKFIDDFLVYANVCFAAFGDRVKYWITEDEPNDYTSLAYASTQSPPGRCSSPGYYYYGNCTAGNSSTEPYLVGHHLILAHSAVAQLYKQEYQEKQKGYIGIALWFKWYEPMDSNNVSDIAAAQRAQDFYFGWFMDPLVFGRYPETMRSMLGPRLPSFTEEEATLLRNSLDFVGLNAVTAMYARDTSYEYQETDIGYFLDVRVNLTGYDDNGVAIGEGDLERMVPWCLTSIVGYMKERYNNPPMYITETGWGIASTSDLEETLNDTERVKYFHSYYETLREAIRDGGDVRGVFAWSLIDGFEFFMGLITRFGLVYVDENMDRYPRLSAFWHQKMLALPVNTTTLALTTHSPRTVM